MIYRTLLLDKSTWDLTVDDAGNLAIAEGSYAVAQDAASACLVFSGECYYNTTLGIPWKAEVLGKPPSTGYLADKIQQQVRLLPPVRDVIAQIFFDDKTRVATGQILITDVNGEQSQVNL